MRSINNLVTGNIDFSIETGDMATESTSMQSRLNALINIASDSTDTGIDGVVVSRSDVSATDEGFTWSITFQGKNVAGNVPQLSLYSESSLGQ